jgi:hypothetical protein
VNEMTVIASLMVLLTGSGFGRVFGSNRANALENLPQSALLAHWGDVASLVGTVTIVLSLLWLNGFDKFMVGLGVLLGLWFLVGFSISAVLGFLITRHLAKKRSSA